MYHKGYISVRAQRAALLFKSIGWTAVAPIVITDLILPVLHMLSYRKNGISENLYSSILHLTQVFLPFCSVWWVIFMLRNFVEADGREVLSVNRYKHSPSDALILFAIYIGNLVLLYGCYTILFPRMALEFVKMFLICFFFFGVTYLFAKISGSMIVMVLLDAFLVIANFVFGGKYDAFPLYFSLESISGQLLLARYLPFGILGIVFIMGSRLMQKGIKS